VWVKSKDGPGKRGEKSENVDEKCKKKPHLRPYQIWKRKTSGNWKKSQKWPNLIESGSKKKRWRDRRINRQKSRNAPKLEEPERGQDELGGKGGSLAGKAE